MYSPNANWSVEQLQAAVAAYAEMSARLNRGEPVTKAHTYATLAEQHGRTANAYKRRFYNISYVLSTMGLVQIPGIGVQSHVGEAAENIIRQAILNTPYFTGTVMSAPMASGILPVPQGSAHPGSQQVTVTRIIRDEAVVRWVLQQAKGNCENCGQPAPFEDAHGNPYLEVHHVKWLADGGSDQVTNAVALCPNCHREFHYGANAAQAAIEIIEKVRRLVAE
jgi:5-methylcytosine-specific restriction protein A